MPPLLDQPLIRVDKGCILDWLVKVFMNLKSKDRVGLGLLLGSYSYDWLAIV